MNPQTPTTQSPPFVSSATARDGVLAALRFGPLTAKQLREGTNHSRRYLYEILSDLIRLGAIRVRPCLRDTRQTYYLLAEGRAAGSATVLNPSPAAQA